MWEVVSSTFCNSMMAPVRFGAVASRRPGSLSETFPLVLPEVDHVEVAIGFKPVLVDLDDQGPNQAETIRDMVRRLPAGELVIARRRDCFVFPRDCAGRRTGAVSRRQSSSRLRGMRSRTFFGQCRQQRLMGGLGMDFRDRIADDKPDTVEATVLEIQKKVLPR